MNFRKQNAGQTGCRVRILSSALVVASVLSGIQQKAPAQEASGGTAAENSPDRVVIAVGEEKLTAADVADILRTLSPQSRAYYENQGRLQLPQYLVRMKVLVQEARKQKLDEQPDLRRTIEIVAASILAEAAQRRIAESVAVPEDQVRELYESKKGEYEQVRLRRILIRTESSILSETSVPALPPLASAEARKKLEELRQQVLAGADFAELARLHSDDGATAASGGDMGFGNYRTFIPPIMQAASRLAPGEVSEIIPTAFGMELVQVVERRTQPLEEVRPQLEATLRQQSVEEKLQELQSQYKIEVDGEFFAPRTQEPPSMESVVTPPGR